MITSDKKLKELSLILNKGNNILISEAIELLRNEQPFKGVIGLLISLYDKNGDYSIRKIIEGFMNDMKDQSATEEVINEIKKQWKSDTISMLLSSCWQSGLDYSDFALDIIEVFLKGDYITAIECLTVIEESTEQMTRKTKDEIIKIIEESPVTNINEKTALTLELITILSR
jgi:hypothetical protein